ncbi:MAG: hypothetical protein KZQ90_06730 [Candidatus Thiodiazotropha sp. (ex Codakia rugifera)]|nr:hypothetical protein [Candidatus Thiodiazotropha sp. (ex Codakia rugifera)]
MSRMKQNSDFIDLDPKAFDRKTLLAAAAGEYEKLHPVIAVALLRRKRYALKDKLSDLAAIIDNGSAPKRARTAAALELGRLGSPEAWDVLSKRQKSRSSVVRKAAVSGASELVRLHGSTHAKAAGATLAEPAPAAFLDRSLQLEIEPFLLLDRSRAQPLTQRKASTAQITQLERDLIGDIGRYGALSSLARTIRCGKRTLMFLPTELSESFIESGDQQSTGSIVGIVATRDTEETGLWSTRYYLVAGSQLAGGETLLRLVTRSGRPIMTGSTRREQGTTIFRMQSLATPGSAPAIVGGEYLEGRLRLIDSLSEPFVSVKQIPEPRR